MKNIIIKTIPVFLIVTALFAGIPAKAHAFDAVQIVDPFCLWSGCGDDAPANVTNTTNNTNSNNNTNSVVNSTNSSVGGNGTPIIVTTPVVTTPIYSYNTGGSYNYSQLGVSCYSTPTYASYGETVIWHASAYGGNNSYYYSWTGTDGLAGNGQSISKAYYSGGYKNASVVVTSGGQTVSTNCDNGVNVSDSSYNYNYNNNYYYNNGYYNNGYYNNGYNNYNNGYYNYAPLTFTCSANVSFAPLGTPVTWSSYVTGGSNYYTYRWNGTDVGTNSGTSITANYNTPGIKTMSLTVYSGSQTIVHDCTGSVTVGAPNYGYNNGYNYNSYNYNNVNNGGLTIACFADATTVRPGIPVTWAAEVTGGNGGNYTYAWTGSDGFSGAQSSVVTSYTSPGTKSATVTVTSGGVSASKACGNTVQVAYASAGNGGNGNGANNGSNGTVSRNNSSNSFTAASLFSLGNIPWGWVAVLIILVLFAMVIYLLYNRNEIK